MHLIDELSQLGSLEALQAAIGALNMTPGWIRRDEPLLWPEPKSEYVPAHWRYSEAKAAMISAGRLISTDLAERRNFVMRNPIFGNDWKTLNTLVSAYQSILPGEKARSHRHAPHALRVILESRGSFSIVDGLKHPMETGDIVLTPGGCWHGHGHDGTEQAYWFDGLDVPLVHLLEPMWVEDHPERWERVQTIAEDSPMRFKWADTQAAIAGAPKDATGWFGRTIELPAPAMPTIQLKVHGWSKGERTKPYRQLANTIYVVMQGSGRSRIGESTFQWGFGDTIAAPMWNRIEHEAAEETIMFAMSDEALMKWSRYHRFEGLR
jgi:gentisate 1,2-dioxygenase